MTSERKQLLAAELVELNAEQDRLRREAMAPIKDRLDEIDDRVDEIEGELGTEYLGRCETCGKHLFEGDLGFRYSDDDIYHCVECAPTWADTKAHFDEFGAEARADDPDGHAAVTAEIEKREAAGTLDEKNVWAL